MYELVQNFECIRPAKMHWSWLYKLVGPVGSYDSMGAKKAKQWKVFSFRAPMKHVGLSVLLPLIVLSPRQIGIRLHIEEQMEHW